MQVTPYLTAAFYKFVELADYRERKQVLLDLCTSLRIQGMILLAHEGINGTIAGAPDNLRVVLDFLRSDPLLHDLKHKESWSDKPPFHRMKIRLKKEIVTLGLDGIHPSKMAGTYVKPKDWNALISDPNVLVIDTRNDYEVELGTFKRAVDPRIKTFADLPDWVENSEVFEGKALKKTKVAMFCTGGIRCEKSTALMKAKGYEDVYHLEGGILKYLEEIPEQNSLWQGECFVFDERVSVGHGLRVGKNELCRCCRQPLAPHAKQSSEFELGVSCPRCYGITTEEQKSSARERQRQCELAASRHQRHVGESLL